MQSFLPLSLQISRLRSQRKAKQTSINKRIHQIIDIISERGSRTKLTAVVNHLERIFTETRACHENLMSLIPEQSAEFSDDWIEDVRLEIDNSLSEVYEYFSSRHCEPTSENSSCIGDDISVC